MSCKLRKVLAVALAPVLVALCCFNSFALSMNEYGLGLDAQQNEDQITVTLKNSNAFDVQNVAVNCTIPDGIVAIGSSSAEADVLTSGNSVTLTFTVEHSEDVSSVASAAADANGSDTIIRPLLITAAVLLIAAVAIVLVLRKCKASKGEKIISLLLTLLMLLPCVNILSFNAFGVDEQRSFTLDDTFTLGGKEYPFSVTVKYTASTADESYFTVEAEAPVPDGGTVTRADTAVSGVAAANGTVTKVTYEVRSAVDGYESGEAREATLDGCEWQVDDNYLKPGDNEVIVTATLDDGTVQKTTYNLNYDSGELYRYTKSEVKEKNDTQYVDKIVNVYFNNDISDARADEIIAEVGGTRVGESYGTGLVQVKVQVEGIDELNKVCGEFEKYDEVTLAGIEEVLDICSQSVNANDPWFNDSTLYNETWDESIPGGDNWSVECVRAPSAWAYNSYYGNVKIGIIDGGVKNDHTDFDDLIHFPNASYEIANDPSCNHGTHVAGIIGAAPNNGKGITGLLWDVDIYAANFYYKNSISYIVVALSDQVQSGAKVVNLSLGLDKAYNASSCPNPYLAPYSEYELNNMARQCAAGLNTLIKSGYEFVVVQSAGNGRVDSRLSTTTYRSIDARQNGLYCAIEKKAYTGITLADATAIYDRIIVVGAIQNTSSVENGADFTMWYRGNSGDRVDVYAPGVNVYSTIAPLVQNNVTYNYAAMTGTSQSAPIVTAIAGLCFSINPNLTGAQVKNIICDDANSQYAAYDNDLVYADTPRDPENAELELHPFTGDGKVVSMVLCAEAALRTVCEKASYTFLNSIVVAAQNPDGLAPSAYANYNTVQAVIDSIDYNLYSFQQSIVDAKALELLDALDGLVLNTGADYSAVDAAIEQANALVATDYIDFSGVTAAINAVVRGKNSSEQAAVDAMALAITNAITALELNLQIDSVNTEIVADNTNYAIVLTSENIEQTASSLTPRGGYIFTAHPNELGTYSTGSTVVMSKDGCEDIVYTVAVLGDANGDGMADGYDVFLIRMYASGMLAAPTGAYFIAADAGCDGIIDENDAVIAENASLDNDVIINLYSAE